MTACQVAPSAEVRTTGCWLPWESAAPTAIQPAGPWATLSRLSVPGRWETADDDAEISVQEPSAARRQMAGWPSAAPTASRMPPAAAIELTVTVPCWPGYPANAAGLPPASGVDWLPRLASISFVLPVSIISAPAPTVTRTAAGTPTRTTCHARRRPAAVIRGPARPRRPGRLADRALPGPVQLVRLTGAVLGLVIPPLAGQRRSAGPARAAAGASAKVGAPAKLAAPAKAGAAEKAGAPAKPGPPRGGSPSWR